MYTCVRVYMHACVGECMYVRVYASVVYSQQGSHRPSLAPCGLPFRTQLKTLQWSIYVHTDTLETVYTLTSTT